MTSPPHLFVVVDQDGDLVAAYATREGAEARRRGSMAVVPYVPKHPAEQPTEGMLDCSLGHVSLNGASAGLIRASWCGAHIQLRCDADVAQSAKALIGRRVRITVSGGRARSVVAP